MNAEEKSAWFIIGVSTAALIAFLILAPFLGFKAAMGSFGLFGFAGLTPLFFRKQPGKVVADERDRIIVRKAAVAGGMSSYLVFVAGCMAAWLIKMVRSEATIDIAVLPLLVFFGAVVLFLVRSVALLVLYRREVGYGQ
jgi:apolipoprotein N-acyltransferase